MSFWCAQASQRPRGRARAHRRAVAEPRELLVVLRDAHLDRVAVVAGVDEPHIASATCSAVSGVARRASRRRARARAARSSPPRSPRRARGNGTPRRWSSQAPLTMANRLRRAIGSVIGASVADPGGSLLLSLVACTRSSAAGLPPALPRGRCWSLVLAGLAMVGTVAIPWLTGRAIDDDRRRRPRRAASARARDRRRRRRAARVLGRAAAGGRPRLARRRVRPAQPALRAPAGARARLLRPPADRPADVARDGRPAVGPLLPRLRPRLHRPERADDRCSRRSRCWRCSPRLGGAGARPVPFVVLVAARYGRRSRPALQEVQQRIAELTADVEENVSGVRVVKAFAAEPRQLERFRHSVARVFDQSMLDPAARLLQPVHRLPAEPRPRRDPALRRAPGHRRDADARATSPRSTPTC